MARTRIHRAGIGCCLAAVTALAYAAPALATEVSVEGAELRIIDRGSLANALEVRPSAIGYDIVDDLTDLIAGPGCVALDPHHVSCAGGVSRVFVDAGGGDDVVSLPGVAVPVVAAGGEGADLIEGGIGGDRLNGGAGEDTVLGDAGDDEIAGASGDDVLQGDAGGDRITGGADADIVQGQAGSGDVLAGNDGPDLVEGGAGDDTLRGGNGADVLVTGSGTDTANPGNGSDQVFGTSGDAVTCGSDDEVRTGSGTPPPGCARVPRGESEPEIWPPPPPGVQPAVPAGNPAPIAAAALSVRAAIIGLPLPHRLVDGYVLRRGNARQIKLRIPSDFDRAVRVRVRTYTQNRVLVDTFYRDIRAKRWQTVDTRRGSSVVWSAKARCCVR